MLYRAMDDIKEVLKNKYLEIILEASQIKSEASSLIRSLDYYDNGGKYL